MARIAVTPNWVGVLDFGNPLPERPRPLSPVFGEQLVDQRLLTSHATSATAGGQGAVIRLRPAAERPEIRDKLTLASDSVS